jgi:hypothetical protein
MAGLELGVTHDCPIFGDTSRFRTTETAPSGVSSGKATES